MITQNTNHFLVVDDHASNIFTLSLILEELGFTHDSAANGLEAVRKYQSGNYTAILMDIAMPIMNGYEACAEIRRIELELFSPNTPIFIITANPIHEVSQKVAHLNIKHIVTKPFKYEDIVQKIQALAA